MKIVFKIARAAVAVTAFLAVLGFCGQAHADSVYFSARELLADFFHSSQAVSYKKLQLSSDEQGRIARRLGYALPKASYTFYVATSNGRVDGYAFIDDQQGEHLPITFAVKLSPEGQVARQEIVVYREPRGDEVRADQFRRQFVGKTAHDPIATDQDIVAISGATISSRAMAVGVKRAVVLFDELIKSQKVVTASR
jgi:hypothetical protein